MKRLFKYPRTRHLEGSRRQPGDEDLEDAPYGEVEGRHLVVEEKLDGANSALSFDPHGELYLQSRGHFLTGGEREKHFSLFKSWAWRHQAVLWEALGPRFTVYGEWLYAKHTVFYDGLPHYFLEFDVLDHETGEFLSTARRRDLLNGLPLVSVPVLHEGPSPRPEALAALIRPSLYKSPGWRDRLRQEAVRLGIDPERASRETDREDLAEGLYLKVEEEGRVAARFKLIRASFLTAVLDSGSHWLSRPVLPNQLAPGVELF
ncbi:MAG: RNA ligase family protein [Candidatus Eremiobacterota bacterium]